MKRFEFRLESLLNYKGHLEQMARQEMARAASDVNACAQGIETLKGNRESAEGRLDTMVEKGMSAVEFRHHYAFLSAVDQLIIDERSKKRMLEKILDEKRSALKKRTIDKKALERLRERRAQEYTQLMLKEEQKELDEISSIKTAREANNDPA